MSNHTNTNPSTYRGLNCKKSTNTDNLSVADGLLSDEISPAVPPDSAVGQRERECNWHKNWYNRVGEDGLHYLGYESMPFVEVRRGFSYWVHGYRATKKEVMTDSDFYKLFASIKHRYGGIFALQPTATKNGIMWEKWYSNENGVSFYCNRYTKNATDIPEHHFLLVVNGSYCEFQPLDKTCYDIVWLYDHLKCNIRRVDPKVRDWEARITFEQLELWRNGGHLRGVRRWERDCGEIVQFPKLNMVVACDRTKYFGKRSSHKFLRVYEPHKLHCASGLDWECEYKDDKADAFARRLVECVDNCFNDSSIPFQLINEHVAREFTKIVADSVLSAISFVELNGKKRDYDIFPEWQEFVDAVMSDVLNIPVTDYSAVKLKPLSRPIPTIAKKIEWLFCQCAPTIAAAAFTFDEDSRENFIRALINDGMDRINVLLKAMSRKGLQIPPNEVIGDMMRAEVMELLPAV